jgi:hypothetical protein
VATPPHPQSSPLLSHKELHSAPSRQPDEVLISRNTPGPPKLWAFVGQEFLVWEVGDTDHDSWQADTNGGHTAETFMAAIDFRYVYYFHKDNELNL